MAISRTRSRRSMKGFTLIEALIATMIVALALITVTTRVSMAAKVAKNNQERTFKRWVAMNAITEIRLKPGLPDTGNSDGDEEMGGIDWRWTMEISTVPGVEELRRVVVTVNRADDAKSASFVLDARVGERPTGANLRPWSGWPDTDNESGGQNVRPGQPGAPVLPGQRPDPRRGLDRTGSR